MKKNKKFFLTMLVIIMGAMILGSHSVSLAGYPESPVSLIVAYSPGGATDFQARIVTMMAGLEKYLGQPSTLR